MLEQFLTFCQVCPSHKGPIARVAQFQISLQNQVLLKTLINSSQIILSKIETWYREGPQKLKKESADNSVNLKQKIKLRVVFPSEKYVEFGRQIEI